MKKKWTSRFYDLTYALGYCQRMIQYGYAVILEPKNKMFRVNVYR